MEITRHPAAKSDIPGFSSRMRIGLLLLAVVLLPILIMWPYRQAGLVSDDFFFVEQFREADWLKVPGEPWPHPLGTTKAWRPLVVISYLAWAEYTAGSPESYRLFNYLIHGLNGLLLTIPNLAATSFCGSPAATAARIASTFSHVRRLLCG